MEQLRLPFTEICVGCKKFVKDSHYVDTDGKFKYVYHNGESVPLCKECFSVYNNEDDPLYEGVWNNVLDKVLKDCKLQLGD